ncbi:Mannose-6-phosphate isomerase, cupin superfamily [Raineyella antarctica]|uniref:Mannose-6-phosphate isomerase, cupin superfamily n=1 Tax=Raineyella antarctica TaxID=1577474 RepID=A0A1G6IGV4_9ACTN|nr:cupin domain-containing protein [Raineyella antarctica]SDC05630.1 Mannose-6-phosphate isomerase, cupin superfamily [Raineyella antarctica]
MADSGPNPYVVNIEDATLENTYFRDTLWTGKYLQMTVMAIEPGGEVGGEIHEDHDQFIRIEQGKAHVVMGPAKGDYTLDQVVGDDWAILIPAGKYHNVINVGDEPLKLYSLYAPPEHTPGTRHETAEDAKNDPQETDLVD